MAANTVFYTNNYTGLTSALVDGTKANSILDSYATKYDGFISRKNITGVPNVD